MDPETHTFSFYGAPTPAHTSTSCPSRPTATFPWPAAGYKSLQQPTKEEEQAISTYSSSKYVPRPTRGEIAFPFIDINNRVLISSASYDPGILASLTWSDIASGLTIPSNPATQAIVATANYISACICAVATNAPASVCDSPGVKAAAKSLKLSADRHATRAADCGGNPSSPRSSAWPASASPSI